jgi:ferredoxin-NADP reductase
MEEHIVKILRAEYLTHDVKRFVVEKPAGYTFIPGQATEVSINTPEFRDQKRPFSFTGLNEWDYLEFIIKIYRNRKGVTNELGQTNAGDELIIRDVWGTIQYEKPGVFIAGGAGITPFIAILRELQRKGQIHGNSLVFSVQGSDDVILEKEFRDMLNSDFHTIFTRENIMGYREREIDKQYLIETVKDFSLHFYVCGPEQFVSHITRMLEELGASSESLVFER